MVPRLMGDVETRVCAFAFFLDDSHQYQPLLFFAIWAYVSHTSRVDHINLGEWQIHKATCVASFQHVFFSHDSPNPHPSKLFSELSDETPATLFGQSMDPWLGHGDVPATLDDTRAIYIYTVYIHIVLMYIYMYICIYRYTSSRSISPLYPYHIIPMIFPWYPHWPLTHPRTLPFMPMPTSATAKTMPKVRTLDSTRWSNGRWRSPIDEAQSVDC